MKKYKVILTRSYKDGKEWVKFLKNENLDVFCIPVQIYKFERKKNFRIPKDSIIIFTSTKGIEAFLKVFKSNKFDCIVLGEREEKLAQAKGFNVLFKSKKPNSNSLFETIVGKFKNHKTLVYPTSEIYNRDFERKLKERLFDLKILVLYKPVQRKISEKNLKIISTATDIIFFSPSQVQNFFSQISFFSMKDKRFWAIGDVTYKILKEKVDCKFLKKPKKEEFLKEILNLRRGDAGFK